MPGSAILTLSGTVTGIPSGQQVVNVVWTIPAAIGEVIPTSLAIGNNVINVPSGARTVMIQPPDGNTVQMTFKGIAGDTGILMDLTLPSFPSLGSAQASFVLSIPSLLSGPVQIAFY